MTSTTLLDARELVVRYGNHEAVHGISLEVNPGEVVGLIGPDGAGKTSTLRVLGGLQKAAAGSATAFGDDCWRARRALHAKLGYLAQRFALYGDLTVDENIQFFALMYGVPEWKKRRRELLELVGLAPFNDRLADRLSGGMKQKLALACTLIHSPRALLLDEPTTGVDPVTRREFWRLLADLVSEGLTLLVATPYLDEAERCTRVLLMHEGSILADARPQEIPDLMPGAVVEVSATPRAAAADALAALETVVDVSVFGTKLHAHLVGENDPVGSIREVLATHEINVESTREISAGLEDTFLYLTPNFDITSVNGGIMKAKQLHLTLVTALAVAMVATPGRAETLSLDAEVAARMAVQASTLTVAAADRVEASQSTVKAADAARLPVLTANPRYTRHSAVPEFGVPTENPEDPVYILFPNIQNHYRVDLSVSQPIYTGGAISASREAAQKEESAASWSETLTALDLSFSARMSYWSAVAAASGVDVAEAQIKRTQRLLDDARALREAGMAVNADVFAAEARYAAAEVDLIRTRNEEAKALTRLRSLLSIAADVTITLKDARTEQVPPSPPLLTNLERDALENRPELKIADAHIEGLGARARSVNAARKPTVAATGQYLLARPNQRFLPPVDEANDSWLVGIAASWQIFDGSRTKEQVATVQAEQRALQNDRSEFERQIRLDVATARLELKSALKAVTSTDTSAAAAKAWEEASSERYAAGIAMLSELLDAQADLAAAEMAQVRSRASAWLADAALRRAVGW